MVQSAGRGRRRLAHSAAGGQRLAGRVIKSRTSLGYEPTDACLRRLGQSLVTVLASTDVRREVVLDLARLPVSARPVASRAQIRAQIGFQTWAWQRLG